MGALAHHGRVFYAVRGKMKDGEERWLRRVSPYSRKWSWGGKRDAEVFEDNDGYGDRDKKGIDEAKRVARYIGRNKNHSNMRDIVVVRVEVALKLGQVWPVDPVLSLAGLAPVEM
jgi:hypothetical protein